MSAPVVVPKVLRLVRRLCLAADGPHSGQPPDASARACAWPQMPA